MARHNATTDEHAVMDYNSYLGMYQPLTEIENAKGFAEQAKAQKLRDMMNMMAEFNSAPYTHYVLKRVSTVTEENE